MSGLKYLYRVQPSCLPYKGTIYEKKQLTGRAGMNGFDIHCRQTPIACYRSSEYQSHPSEARKIEINWNWKELFLEIYVAVSTKEICQLEQSTCSNQDHWKKIIQKGILNTYCYSLNSRFFQKQTNNLSFTFVTTSTKAINPKVNIICLCNFNSI